MPKNKNNKILLNLHRIHVAWFYIKLNLLQKVNQGDEFKINEEVTPSKCRFAQDFGTLCYLTGNKSWANLYHIGMIFPSISTKN
jgi:hypothetical protein